MCASAPLVARLRASGVPSRLGIIPPALFVCKHVQNTANMKKERINYEAPTAETLVVRFEGVVCESNVQANTASRVNYGVVYDDLDGED